MIPKKGGKMLLDLETLNTINAQSCAACGNKFNLGDTVVPACGAWGDDLRYVHENEAVLDKQSGCYVERRAYEAGQAGS